ncbi:molybdopterin-dependent oxidoreductase [Kaistella sp.]|uniref:molybdopterin-dependent oxidoreductase n=1 Tax=Kaistella sp. TaxID=2782235 RepID=UPI003C562FBD
MIPHFTAAERAVHYPADRRAYLGMKRYMKIILFVLFVGVFGAAWLQYLLFGLPIDPSASFLPLRLGEPSGFPVWIRLSHWVNFFFLILMIRSGLSILADHPRLYWNNSCKPNSGWIYFTPINVPLDRPYTAKEDARYLNPILGLPGYKHTVGIARVWHFLTVPFFVLNGAVFISLLFFTNQWKRLVPQSWQIIPDSWSVFVHYATFNFPVEPNGFYHYNAIQQLSYFGVIFILAPLAMLTGMAMAPAIENRFRWYPKLFGNRQSARSIHFLVMISYCVFIVIHVGLVAATGLVGNMNHIVMGTDSSESYTGLYIGIAIVLITIAFAFLVHWLSWYKHRFLQQLQASTNGKLWKYTINRFKAKTDYEKKEITSYFWLNGKMPESSEWKNLAENNFADYKLKIGGLVENPVELSLKDLKELGKEQNITMHHCIQGWSGIAEWGGVPLRKIIELVKPDSSVTTVAFYSYGEGLYGGTYYDTHTIGNCLKPDSILAWEMNYEPLSLEHGAPLRLRVENQLGYKMVKWIQRIEFVKSPKDLGKGFGGTNEDDEYFDLMADS